MKLEEYPDREMLAMSLANRLAGDLNSRLMHIERASLAVPGGTTPGPVFDALSAADLDWARVDVVPTDERQVPAEDARSNERLLRERLLTGRAAAARFHRLSPEADISALLPVSVLLLGMGEDMHTASLFPGAEGLAAALSADAPAVMAIDAPGMPEPRITLTGPVLSGAIRVHVLITGAGKRAALSRAQENGPTARAPIRVVLDAATVHWAE